MQRFVYFIVGFVLQHIHGDGDPKQQQHTHNNHFTALCPGLPGWAGTRRNTHPTTILIIIQSLSASSIYRDP